MSYPSILIVSPTKNDAKYLGRHLAQWNKINYPKERIRWVWMYGRSVDKTLDILLKFFKKNKWNVEIKKEPLFENKTQSAIWIADVMNALRKEYKDEDYVVLDDTDIVKIPENLLTELIGLNLDIVAPYVWIEGTPLFFDTYVFRDLNGNKFPPLNPPISDEPIELSSVGTLVIIKGKIFKEINFENPVHPLQFCKNARRKGYKVYGIPWIEIIHANIIQENNEYHMPLEWYVEQGVLPKEVLEKVK